MSALDYLSLKIKSSIIGEARLLRSGSDALKGPISIKPPDIALSTDVGPAVAGGADQMLAQVYSIAGGGTLDIDLTTFTDAMLRATTAMARIKCWYFFLLSSADVVGSVTGTACSGVVIGNAASNAHLLNLGGTTPTFTLLNGEFQLFGSRSAAGRVVDPTHKDILVTNSDATLAAKLLVAVIGGSA